MAGSAGAMSRFAVRVAKLWRAATGARREAPVRRILIAHQLLLGDTLLLAPLLKALAARHPEAERVLLVKPPFLPLFSGEPYGVRSLGFDRRDARSQRRVMDSGPYDLALVPDDNRYAWLARAAGARWIRGFAADRPAWKNWMLDAAVPYPDQPAAWADMAVALGGCDAPPPFVPGEWPAPRVTAAAPVPMPAPPYAVLHVGASSPLKAWPPERWRVLADALAALGLGTVWSAGPGEGGLVEAVGARTHETVVAGRLDLAGLWSLFAGAALLVCPDTGVAHLARLVGVPTVALFGPGSAVVHGAGQFWADAPFRAVTDAGYPCRDQTRLFRREVVWVRRCGRAFGEGAGQCPKAGCMDVLAAGAVLEAVRDLLGHAQDARQTP